MLIAGVAVLLLGIGFFVKFAIDNEWITPTMRVGAGALVGVVLVVAGASFVRRGYVMYGRLLAGGGFAAMYLSAYAAFAFYGLIGRTPEFVLLFLISLAAATFADRLLSPGLALFAVCGGFLAPFLLEGRADQQFALFSYDLVLVALTLVLAERHDWPHLNLASYVLTVATIWGWSVEFYAPSKYAQTELFLTAFGALFVLLLQRSLASKHPMASFATLMLSFAPFLYHSASVVILMPHSAAFLVYSVVATAVAIAVARAYGRAWPRLVALLLVVAPLFGWLEQHLSPRWMTPAMATFTAIYIVHLGAVIDRLARRDQQLAAADVASFHLAGVSLFAASYIMLDVVHPDSAAAVAFVLAGWHLALAGMLRRLNADAALNGVALGSGLLAAALAIQFSGAWLTIGWIVEGVALLWLAHRTERQWLYVGAMLLVAAGVVRATSANFAVPSISFVPILNRSFASGCVAVIALYSIAMLQHRSSWRPFGTPVAATIATLAANVVTLAVLSGQIEAYWQVNHDQHNAELRHQLMLSITWAAYAAGLIAVGMWRSNAALRYLGIFVFAMTLGKAFTVDLAELGGIYRVTAFVLLGVLLLWASFLYQRLVKRAGGRAFPESTPMPPPPAEIPSR